MHYQESLRARKAVEAVEAMGAVGAVGVQATADTLSQIRTIFETTTRRCLEKRRHPAVVPETRGTVPTRYGAEMVLCSAVVCCALSFNVLPRHRSTLQGTLTSCSLSHWLSSLPSFPPSFLPLIRLYPTGRWPQRPECGGSLQALRGCHLQRPQRRRHRQRRRRRLGAKTQGGTPY